MHRVSKNITPPFCLRYKLFFPKPISIIFGRNVAKGHCNVKMLTYLMLSLSLAVGYQLKYCYNSRRQRHLIDTWSGMQQSVTDEACSWPVAQTAQGLFESQKNETKSVISGMSKFTASRIHSVNNYCSLCGSFLLIYFVSSTVVWRTKIFSIYWCPNGHKASAAVQCSLHPVTRRPLKQQPQCHSSLHESFILASSVRPDVRDRTSTMMEGKRWRTVCCLV